MFPLDSGDHAGGHRDTPTPPLKQFGAHAKFGQCIEKTDIEGNWGELSGVLYWVSMIGSASSQARPGHRLLDSTLGRTMSEIAFTASDFGSAVESVRQFSHLQMALKR